MFIVIGRGVIVGVEVDREPVTGDEINLGDDKVLRRGRYRLTRKGEWKGDHESFPYFNKERVGEVPEGEKVIPIETFLGC